MLIAWTEANPGSTVANHCEVLRLQKKRTIKPLKFGDEALPGMDGGAMWQTILQDMMGNTAISAPEGNLSGMRGLFWSHVSLSLTTLYFPQSFVRLSAAGARDSGIVVLRAMEGRLSIEQRQWRVEAAKADVVFLPANSPMSFILPEGGRLDCAYLPGHALGPTRKSMAHLLMRPIPCGCLPLQLLLTYAGYLLQQEYQAERDAEMMVAHFYDLLPVLADNLGRGIPRFHAVNRLAAIKSHIEGNLTDSVFSIADVAGMEGITVRAIQKLFRREGTTFSRYLLERRLELAKAALLLNGAFTPITQIAFDVGFDDPSYFSRTFRKRYGMRPLDLRRSVVSTDR